MPDMREALNQFAQQDPDSPIARDVRRVRREDARKRELEKLSGEFSQVGRQWLQEYALSELRSKWDSLKTNFARLPSNDQAQMLSKLASGMQISEDQNSRYHRFAITTALEKSIANLKSRLGRAQFSPASRVFVEALSELAGYSPEERSAFKKFLYQSNDLKGLVKSPQIFPLVARWLVKQN